MTVHASRGGQARGCAVAVLACAAVLLPANAAAAHGSGQTIPDLAYYRSELSAVVPTPPGVTARVDPAGEWLELAATGPTEVVVLGYTREPYLRIKGGVVEENQLSQTTYLNRSLFADSVPTGQDSGGLAPAWKQIGSAGVVRWHDHRIHWMGQERPPAVRDDPRHPHPVGTWTVHATVNGSPIEIRGTLRWLGKPASASGIQAIPEWVLWVVEALTVVLGGLSLAVMAKRQRRTVGQVTADAEPPVHAGSVW